MLFLLLHNLFLDMNIYSTVYGTNGYKVGDVMNRLFTIVFKMSGEEALLGGFWFLKVLFFASLLLFLIRRVSKNVFINMGGVMALALVFRYQDLHIPFWGLNSTLFMAVAIMLAGIIYKRYDDRIHCKSKLIVVCFAVVVLGAFLWPGSMLRFTAIQCMPYTLSGIAGSIMVLEICRIAYDKMTNGKLLSVWKYIGDNTLIILSLHMLSFKLASWLIVEIYNLPNYRMAEFITIHDYSIRGWWILYSIIGVAIPLVANLLLKNNLLVWVNKLFH